MPNDASMPSPRVPHRADCSARSAPRDFTGVEGFRAAHRTPAEAPPWWRDRRAAALAALERSGFPGPRDEDWKYTSARTILRGRYVRAQRGALGQLGDRFLDPEAPRILFVDGQRVDGQRVEGHPGLADDRVSVGALGQVAGTHEAVEGLFGSVLGEDLTGFDALNTSVAEDGLFVDVPDGCVLAAPLHVVHVHTGHPPAGDMRVSALRNVIRVGRDAEVTVIEHFLGEGPGLTSAVTEIVGRENARIRHVRVQEEDPRAFHVGTVAVRLARDAELRSHLFTVGGAISRVDLKVALEGAGAGCSLVGLALLKGAQHGDHHTHVDHRAPHTRSQQLFKGIIDDTGHGVFTGRVVVRPGAQQIDANQQNPNLLLGARAVATTRPQLEIHADDVKCAHGASVGRIDPETEFYARQRGLGVAETRGLLTWAFANEIVATLPAGALRSALEDRVWAWLGHRGER